MADNFGLKIGLEGEKGQDISQHGKKSGHTA